MPNRPLSISASTSSEVWPIKANSKSWIIPAPFMATAVTIPRSIKFVTIGARPTLMTWAPMPTITGRPFRCAVAIALATARSVLTPRMSGRVA